MQRHRLELEPGLFLDARRAVWFEQERALVVADLHLGYAWGSRSAGTMLPLEVPDDTLERLAALACEYRPRELFVLGDIVHKAVALRPVQAELRKLHECLSGGTLRLLAGNHDRGLPRMLGECGLAATLELQARLGPHLLLHGDVQAQPVPGRTFIGHEHPAIRVGDGVASVKCPCFLLSPKLIVLPAFSLWAAGSEVRSGTFLSPMARGTRFTQAAAILAGKLLPVPLK